MEYERVRNLLSVTGVRIAGLPEADAQVSRLKTLRSPSEFKAFLAGVPALPGAERRRELAIAAAGPEWRAHRDRLVRVAESAHERAGVAATGPKE